MKLATNLVGALGAFGALAYLMAPLPPETPPARIAAATSTEIAAATAPDRAAVDYPSTTGARAMPPPAPPQDPAALLVRQLQTELLRLGCYEGAINGQWSAETREAMHVLGERVRVLRPVETPDYIMLALARSQESHVCVPQGKATASRQPAQLVPMAGLVPLAEPSAVSNERARRTSTPVRAAQPAPTGTTQPAPSRSAARRDVGIVTGPVVRLPIEVPTAEDLPASDRASLERSRMSLGAATVDPQRTGSEPRDPTAPAIFPDASPVTSPITARGETGLNEVGEPTTVRDVGPAPASAHPPASPRSRKRAWSRTFFSEMSANGP